MTKTAESNSGQTHMIYLVQCCGLHRLATSATILFRGGEAAHRKRVMVGLLCLFALASMQRSDVFAATLDTTSLGSQLMTQAVLLLAWQV